MRYPAMGAVFARLSLSAALMLFLLPPSLTAQVHGTPPSVTSFGFGGHNNFAPGVPASVTSLGRFGFSGGGGHHPFRTTCCVNTQGYHHRRQGFYPSFYSGYYPVYGYALPYEPEVIEPDAVEAPPPDEYLGGPTIFDRRGPGPSYPGNQEAQTVPRPPSVGAPETTAAPQPSSVAPDQPQTLLVFKDGRKLELQNYAIVGDTLYDLSGGRRHRIALSDLDLKTTIRENDDRGIDFMLPANIQVN